MRSHVSHTLSLTAIDAANALRAARLNALDLMDTADLLFNHKRFAHALALAILAIEEAGKFPILFDIFLGLDDDTRSLWKKYRRHQAKTELMNVAVYARVRVAFPDSSPQDAKTVADRGPSPEELEESKQLAIYSDCLNSAGEVIVHVPQNVDWRVLAWDRICEAKSMIHALRDHPPEELAVWRKYAEAARLEGVPFQTKLSSLHSELLALGFIREGWWEQMLQDLGAAGGQSGPANGSSNDA